MYVSLSAGIKNSRSFWSTGAIVFFATSVTPSTDVCVGLCAKMSNSILTDAISTAADITGSWRVTEVKLGKVFPFYYFSRGTLFRPPLIYRQRRSVVAFAAPAPQCANQLLGGFSDIFRHYIPGSRRVGRAAFSDIVQDLATGTQRLAALCFVPAPRSGRTQEKRVPKKLPIPCPSWR